MTLKNSIDLPEDDYPFKRNDVVVYGPLMTHKGYIYNPMIIHSTDTSKTYYPVKSQLKSLNAGLCVVSYPVYSGDKFDTLALTNVSCREACPEELLQALKKSDIIPNLISPNNIKLYKCYNSDYTDFIYMAMTHNNVYYNDKNNVNPSIKEAFKGLDPNRDSFYPFHPKAFVLIKRAFGDIKIVKTSNYSLPYLYNKYHNGQLLETNITDDTYIDRIMLSNSYDGSYIISSYISSLANVNRNEEFTEKPELWAVNGRFVMRTHTKGCYVVYKDGLHVLHSYLCPSNQYKHLCVILEELGITPIRLSKEMEMLEQLCIRSERYQGNRLISSKVIEAVPNISHLLSNYITEDVIQGYLTESGLIQLKLNWLYKTRNAITRVKRVFPEIDAYHTTIGLNIPKWSDDIFAL